MTNAKSDFEDRQNTSLRRTPRASLGEMPSGPLERAGERRSVIVIGAGMAGLCAAHRLHQAGHEVLVLEASSRPGGRIQTVREPFTARGLHAEAGALFLPSYHKRTMGYAHELKLPLTPVPPDPVSGTVWHLRDQWVISNCASASEWPVQFSETEQQLVTDDGFFGLWEKYLLTVASRLEGQVRFSSLPKSLEHFDAISIEEMFVEEGASPGAIEALRLGYLGAFGDGIDSVSALHILRDLAASGIPPHFKPPVHLCVKPTSAGKPATAPAADEQPASEAVGAYVVTGGNDNFPRAFATWLDGCIRYEEPVVRIESGEDRVGVVCETPNGPRRYEADRLIVAIPFPVLRGVTVDPGFSPAKERAIRSLKNTSVTRLFIETSSREWTPDRPFDGKSVLAIDTANTDSAATWVHDATIAQPGQYGIVEGVSAGSHARWLQGMAEEDRLTEARRIFSTVYPGIGPHLGVGTSKCWDEDPWALGAYCYFQPGQMAELLPAVQQPEGRIHFAGDQTSVAPGWIEGALESGLRAAGEVNEGLLQDERAGLQSVRGRG